MAVAFGHIREFELGTESISAYLERLQMMLLMKKRWQFCLAL